jgi:transcriptional regulator with XRE-family HTH domain
MATTSPPQAPIQDAKSAEANLADRINTLFQSHRRPDGRMWTNDEVASGIKKANPDIKVGGAYLSALRTGKRARPAIDLLGALADFFRVPLSVLTDPERTYSLDERLGALDETTRDEVELIALRAIGLNKQSLETVAAVLDHVRALQGLPTVDNSASNGQ